MNPRRSIRPRGSSQTGRAVVWCLLLLGLCGALIGQTPQKKPTPQVNKRPVDVSVIQLANQRRTPKVIPLTPTPTPTPAIMTPITLHPSNTAPIQGQLVTFTIQPPPPQNAIFAFDFQDGQFGDPTEVGGGEFSHRFRNAGEHRVTVTIKPPSGAIARAALIFPKIEPVTINVSPLTLSVTPQGQSLLVNQELTFSTQDLKDNNVRYRFIFDNKKNAANNQEETSQAYTTHAYQEQGDHQAHVELVFLVNDQEQKIVSPSQTVTINPRPPNKVTLTINPASARVDEQVVFIANYEPGVVADARPVNLEYQFSFGDGQPSGWSPNASVQHQYHTPAPYQVVVEVRDARTKTLLAKSDQREVVIRANRWEIDPAVLIGIVIVLFGAGTSVAVYKWWPRSPKPPASIPSSPPISQPPLHSMPHPTVVLHTDRDALPTQKPPLSLGLQVHFSSEIAMSQTRLTTEGESLIKLERRDV